MIINNIFKSLMEGIRNVKLVVFLKYIIKIPLYTLIAFTLYCILIENGWYPGLNGKGINISYSQFWSVYWNFTLSVFIMVFIARIFKRTYLSIKND